MRKSRFWLIVLAVGLVLMLPSMAMASDAPIDSVSVMQVSDSDPPDMGLIIDHIAAMQAYQMRTKDNTTIAPSADPVAQVIKTGTISQITPAGLSLRFENSTRVRSPILTVMGVDGFGQCSEPGHNHISRSTG